MALDFRLEAKQSGEYVDLFPVTNVNAIVNASNALHIKTLPVVIAPPTTEMVDQDIAIVTDDKMLESPFECYLVDNGEDAMKAYSTISQMQVMENTLRITRIGNMPKTAINAMLMFYEKGVGEG